MHKLDKLVLNLNLKGSLEGYSEEGSFRGRCTLIGLTDVGFIVHRHDDEGHLNEALSDIYFNPEDRFTKRRWFCRSVTLDDGTELSRGDVYALS